MIAPALERPRGGEDDARAFLGAELVRARTAPAGQVTVVTLPAPAAPLEALFRAAPRDVGVLWSPPAGPAFAGWGAACRLDVHGERRFAELAAKAARAFARVRAVAHPALAGRVPGPRLFGGLAFAPGGAEAEPWRGFSDGCFVLPRWSYGRLGRRAWLSVAITAPRPALLHEYDVALAALRVPAPPPAGASAGGARVTHVDPAAWRARVEAIRGAIAEGRVEKVVAARAARVELAAPVDDAAVLERLAAEHAGCWRFAFRRGAATFLGASPERLITRAGLDVASEALAGSAAAGAAAGRLMDSRKDRDEQHVVVRAIARALAPFCASLDVPAEPELRALRHLSHLRTPIRGRLRAPRHLLELAAALHPTPAVGGAPADEAARWIAGGEPEGRGWYAGPVGWFDAAGDGELAVALRSGVLAGRRAWVWAGAGIVRGSDPAAEWTETALKQQALLRALGVDP